MKRKLYMTNKHKEHEGEHVVADRESGKVLFTSRHERVALRFLLDNDGFAQLVAAADDEQYVRWEADPAIAFEDTETGDRRFINPGAIRFRDLPLPVMTQTETAWGHDGAVLSGRIDEWERRGKEIWAAGVFDDGDVGIEAARLTRGGFLRGVSIDGGESNVELEILEMDEYGWPTDWLERYLDLEVMGVTQTPFPAFAEAAIKVTTPLPEDDDVDAVAASVRPRTVVAAGIVAPPVKWFADPQFDEATPLTITDEGRILGHIATWGTCHIGRENVCLTPPKSVSDYAFFTTGIVRCDDGCEIPVGVISMKTGHADLELGHRDAAAHYDHTGFNAAQVAVGEDAHGIWIAGGVRPGISEEDLAVMRSSSPSGDWRRIGGSLELVAVLMVNVPGFPVPRARVASGITIALTAAATIAPTRTRTVEERLARLERFANLLSPVAGDVLARKLHA